MPTPIKLGGETVDMDDACAMAAALKKVRLRLAAGDVEEMARFGEDEVRFSRANGADLDKEIDRYERACAAAAPSAARRRFAKTMRFRGGCR
jgi:hypothetical protein